MIKVKNSEIRNLASEMNLKEWQVIAEKIDRVKKSEKEFGAIDTWFEIFEMLGAKEEDLDELKGSELLELITKFNKEEIKNDFVRVYKTEGKTFEAYKEGKEFIVIGKITGLVERIVKLKGKDATFPEIMAAIFKDTEASKEDQNSEAIALQNAVHFENMSSEIAIPYLAAFGVEISEIVKIKKDNGIAEELDGDND